MRILVVEDNEKHLRDAKEYCARLVHCLVDFATTLSEAVDLLQKNSYDGVISDVFFPAEAGASAETFQNAISLSAKLVEMGIHHVFNTAGNHHGSEFDGFLWATPKTVHNNDRYHFLTTGMIIESYPKGIYSEKDSKQWQAAFRYILIVPAILANKDGRTELPIGFPYGDYGQLTTILEKWEKAEPFFREVFASFNA